jgi:hypothetical protein
VGEVQENCAPKKLKRKKSHFHGKARILCIMFMCVLALSVAWILLCFQQLVQVLIKIVFFLFQLICAISYAQALGIRTLVNC